MGQAESERDGLPSPGGPSPDRPAETDRLPPGQRLQRGWPVTHYGPVPKFRPERWEFRVFGATADGDKRGWSHEEFTALGWATVEADLHCVTRFSVIGAEWGGVPARTLLDLVPPSSSVTHVMVWAEYGYSANLRLADFAAPHTVFATHKDGEPLTAEHGYPVRLVVPHLYAWKGPKWVRGIEYMTADRRGFWEERGYHNIGDPWREQRYSYQEEAGDGPGL
ncbi:MULTISPECIES: sulfite oxidase-like oxidoreductase [unclassified Streptomyces]|uniref:sulfite oxidase-like oxidoreductase n=1 Tax=unclassified Streptomyces TaxID=2593676 RepID=UPI00081D6BFF|nr:MULTISPECIES: sulfite oxidase-like oxidoreductase [unclassified Streptomyces]SCD52589.1 DMSO/TMAO reductase YedYZ, molybdopterin-dependent catalytic subunit [Streptomyces sp. TverLS-915]SCE66842.1 DMSO/TMAO reductase YedYZ, molybdopterin-dependent catalytic subunit [Streptomyces sp. LcepLS]